MLFNSLTFLVFFVIVFTLHRLIPGWNSKKLLLLFASYLFYVAGTRPTYSPSVAPVGSPYEDSSPGGQAPLQEPLSGCQTGRRA